MEQIEIQVSYVGKDNQTHKAKRTFSPKEYTDIETLMYKIQDMFIYKMKL